MNNELAVKLNTPKYTKAVGYVFYCLVVVSIALSILFPYYLFVLFGICFIFILCSPINNIFELVFFLLPFDLVLKLNTSGISFFTIISLFALLTVIIKEIKTPLKYTGILLYALFIIYIFVVSLDIKLTAGYLLGGLFLFYFLNNYSTELFKKCVLAFSLGIIIGAIFMISNLFPRLDILANTNDFLYTATGVKQRFGGLSGDPNYFSVDVLIAIMGIWQLGRKNLINKYIFFILFIALSGFGLLTLSKSFILLYLLICVLIYFYYLKNNIEKGLISGILIVCFLSIFLIVYSDLVNLYLYRFTDIFKDGFNINTFLTGRVSIWINYWENIKANINTVLFGYGIDAPYVNGRAPHNSYIEIIYYVGFVGSVLYIFSLIWIYKFSAKKTKQNLEKNLPLLIFLGIIFALAFFASDDIFYYYCVLLGIKCLPKHKRIYKANNGLVTYEN